MTSIPRPRRSFAEIEPLRQTTERITHLTEPSGEQMWPDPKPLKCELLPVESFAEEMLPDSLRAWVMDNAELMQMPADYAAAAAVVALAGVVNRRARMQPKAIDRWHVIPNLWGAVVGAPGVMKTATLNRMLKPLADIEARLQKENQDAWAAFEEEKRHSPKNKGGDSDEPEEPRTRRVLVNDATFEKLHEILRDNPAGVTVVRDELTGWLGELTRAGREGERAFFLAAWDGNTTHAIDRIKRGSIFVPAVCLSMVGGIQPKRLASYLAGENGVALSDDGLLQRFQLAVWPDISSEYQYVDRMPNEKAQRRAERVLRELSMLNPDQPLFFKFDADAQELFVTWFVALERRLRSDELSPVMASHLAKFRSLMPSLALLFELAGLVDDWCSKHRTPSLSTLPDSFAGSVGFERGVVHLENAKRAIQWCEYLESHARRIYSCAGGLHQFAALKLAERICRGAIGANEFTPREIVKRGWKYLGSTEAVKQAGEILQKADWLREVTTKPGELGGRPSIIFKINPKIDEKQWEEGGYGPTVARLATVWD